MKKPITEHLNDLPEEYREDALRLHQESGWANDGFELRSDALVNAFPWFEDIDSANVFNALFAPKEQLKSGQKWADLYNDIKSKGL